MKTNENMSQNSAGYQNHVTGQPSNTSYLQNGVKFDGYKNGVLVDAKAGYNNFINKKTGKFHKWFTGHKGLMKQAERQLGAANGTPIQWHFQHKEVKNLIEGMLKKEDLNITCIFNPL